LSEGGGPFCASWSGILPKQRSALPPKNLRRRGIEGDVMLRILVIPLFRNCVCVSLSCGRFRTQAQHKHRPPPAQPKTLQQTETGCVGLIQDRIQEPVSVRPDHAIAAANESDNRDSSPRSQRHLRMFYVYPTFSQRPTPNIDRMPGRKSSSVISSQFARFASHVVDHLAPLYRQVT